MHLSGGKVEVHVVEGQDSREALDDSLHFDETGWTVIGGHHQELLFLFFFGVIPRRRLVKPAMNAPHERAARLRTGRSSLYEVNYQIVETG